MTVRWGISREGMLGSFKRGHRGYIAFTAWVL